MVPAHILWGQIPYPYLLCHSEVYKVIAMLWSVHWGDGFCRRPNTHIKSRVEVTSDVELFPYILDNTGWCYYFLYDSQWDQCSTTPIKGEPYAKITPTSATTTLLLFCVQFPGTQQYYLPATELINTGIK